MKPVLSLIYDLSFCTMGWSWWSTYSAIDEVGLFMALVIGLPCELVGRILLFWGYLQQELWQQRVWGVAFLLQISGWCYWLCHYV